MAKTYYIVSLKHTSKGDTALTLWGRGCCGYVWDKQRAGIYQEDDRAKIENFDNVFIDSLIADQFFLAGNDYGDVYTALPNNTTVCKILGLNDKFMKPKKYASCRIKFTPFIHSL